MTAKNLVVPHAPGRVLDHIAAAHALTGAPGMPTRLRQDGRYVAEEARDGREPRRRLYRYALTTTGVRVSPCWTTTNPDGTKVQHRKTATA